MAGDAGNSSVDEYSSAEECAVSPLMSHEAYQLLDNANSMYNLNSMYNINILLGENLFESPPGVSHQPDPFLSDYEERNSNPSTELHVFESQRRDHDSQTNDLETTNNNEDFNNQDNNQLHKNDRGYYNFEANFHGNNQTNPAKSTPWTYSPMLDMLFVSFNLPCPVKFSFGKEPPFGCVIRATPYFKHAENAHFPVLRCLNHQSPKEPSNQGFIHTEHIIRCDSSDAVYEKNAAGRLSVVVPYSGDEHFLGHQRCKYLNYFFTCFSSCVGGMNRRPIVVVFSLEHGNTILGQKAVEVRICACPGRDRLKFERLYARKMDILNAQSNNATPDSRSAAGNDRDSPPFDDAQERQPPEKRARLAENEPDRFLVSVQFWVNGKDAAKIYQGVLNSIKSDATMNCSGNRAETSPNIETQRSAESMVMKQEE